MWNFLISMNVKYFSLLPPSRPRPSPALWPLLRNISSPPLPRSRSLSQPQQWRPRSRVPLCLSSACLSSSILTGMISAPAGYTNFLEIDILPRVFWNFGFISKIDIFRPFLNDRCFEKKIEKFMFEIKSFMNYDLKKSFYVYTIQNSADLSNSSNETNEPAAGSSQSAGSSDPSAAASNRGGRQTLPIRGRQTVSSSYLKDN